jgi:hypothetical protein
MTAEIIKLPYSVTRGAFSRKPRASKNGTPEERAAFQEIVAEVVEEVDARALAGALSATAANGRLRKERGDAWWAAWAATRYWRARLKFEDAISTVQRGGLPEGDSHPAVDPDDRRPMVEKWRAALVRQLLTPAPHAAAVKWKQTELAKSKGQIRLTDVKPERIECAITEDLAFLAAHPVRQSNRQRQG